ncbi:hypothetical protein ACLOJK_006202 [Asimina triloba]
MWTHRPPLVCIRNISSQSPPARGNFLYNQLPKAPVSRRQTKTLPREERRSTPTVSDFQPQIFTPSPHKFLAMPKCDTFSSLSALLFFSFSFSFLAMVAEASTPLFSILVPEKPSKPLICFLERLQVTALRTLGPANFDPKLYVDLPLKHDLSATEAAFAKLPRSENGSVRVQDLEGFLGEYFGEAGSDLVEAEPADFVPVPAGFLPKVESPEVRAWALEVHSLWKNLSRKVSDGVRKNEALHTLLPLAEQVVVPGSRFREVYYWDSYWVIRGLLVSKMYDTATSIVSNLMTLIEEYGFVLNGARTYYTNRSQPPLLSAMVTEIYKKTGNLSLIKRALPSLLKEHHFWTSGIIILNEASTLDEESASKLVSASEKENFYLQVASAAESGWDFSSRWMRNSSDLTTLTTTSIIPVDLNAYILKRAYFVMELDIAFLAGILGESSIAERYSAASQARHASVNSIFWNANMSQWLDYWLVNNNSTEDNNGEWDFPNGWAPLQHMIVEGLANSGLAEGRVLAEDIVVRWIRTNYAAYKSTGAMHEKYDVEACGKTGGGGEYKPQTGFGWSNGVVLAFLEEFGFWYLIDVVNSGYSIALLIMLLSKNSLPIDHNVFLW